MKKKTEEPEAAFKFSHSKLAEFRRCRQRYHWKYIDKHFPPSAVGQMRGTCGHAALANWHVTYNAEAAMQIAWQTWENAGYSGDKEWQLLEDALNRYFAWSIGVDKGHLELITAEQEFNIEFELPTSEKVLLNGFIDGIVKEGEHLWLLENKFYKQMDNSAKDLDIQSSIYLLVSRILDYDVRGVIYNMVRVADTKVAIAEPVVRRRVYRNTLGLEHIQEELLLQVQDMMDYHKKGGRPYRNPTKDCDWDCPFRQPCLSLQDDGQEPTELLKAISQTRRNENGE